MNQDLSQAVQELLSVTTKTERTRTKRELLVILDQLLTEGMSPKDIVAAVISWASE